MKIDGNPMEKEAMAQFHQGNDAEGHRLQDGFVREFEEAYQGKDHCTCTNACKFHGNCRVCVAIHRAHKEHVPNCFHPMLNERIAALSELTEHSCFKDQTP